MSATREQTRSPPEPTAVPSIIGFGISFAVIGLFWVGHHSLLRHIIAFDRPLMAGIRMLAAHVLPV